MINELDCCAVAEIYGLENNPQTTLENMCEDWVVMTKEDFWRTSRFNGTYFIFTDISQSMSGDALAKYIKRHKLGRTTTLPYRKNPNSVNKVKVWLWSVNIRALKKWYKNINNS